MRRALPAAVLSGALALAFASSTGIGTSLAPTLAFRVGANVSISQQTLATPLPWIIMAGWIVSAVLMSALCSRATRVSSAVGACLAAAVLVAAQAVGRWSMTRSWSAPDPSWLLAVVPALVLTIIIGALGAPCRTKGVD